MTYLQYEISLQWHLTLYLETSFVFLHMVIETMYVLINTWNFIVFLKYEYTQILHNVCTLPHFFWHRLMQWVCITWKRKRWWFNFDIVRNHNEQVCCCVSYLVVSNGNKSSFLHDKVCSTLSFCQQTQFSGSRCKCYPYLITKACLFNNTYPSSNSGNEESHIKEPGPLINLFFSDCT